MTPTSNKTQGTSNRRGRPKKTESYVDWVARIDASVDAMARTMERKKPPAFNAYQRRILEMLSEHMQGLPEIPRGQSAWEFPAYAYMNNILTHLFRAKYPAWTQRTPAGYMDPKCLPNGEELTFERLLRNCAGRAPLETAQMAGDDDE